MSRTEESGALAKMAAGWEPSDYMTMQQQALINAHSTQVALKQSEFNAMYARARSNERTIVRTSVFSLIIYILAAVMTVWPNYWDFYGLLFAPTNPRFSVYLFTPVAAQFILAFIVDQYHNWRFTATVLAYVIACVALELVSIANLIWVYIKTASTLSSDLWAMVFLTAIVVLVLVLALVFQVSLMVALGELTVSQRKFEAIARYQRGHRDYDD